MAETLFRDLELKEGVKIENDAYLFEEKNPLDETKLREIESELSALTGCDKNNRVRISILSLDDYNKALRKIVPQRLLNRGLASHFPSLVDPRDKRHIIVGPSALAGLNEGHVNIVSGLIYNLISATGNGTNQAFERGLSDLLAKEIGQRLDIEVFADHYPEERAFVEALLEASKPDLDMDLIELLGVFKKDPNKIYKMIYNSGFYDWWSNSVAKDDQLSSYIDLLKSMTAPNAQLEGSFMGWAKSCALTYRDFRLEQQRKGRLSAQKRNS